MAHIGEAEGHPIAPGQKTTDVGARRATAVVGIVQKKAAATCKRDPVVGLSSFGHGCMPREGGGGGGVDGVGTALSSSVSLVAYHLLWLAGGVMEQVVYHTVYR